MKPLKEFRLIAMKDTLPMVINKHEATIVNLDNNDGPGTHWTLIYNRPSDHKYVYYFDSYGVAPPEEVQKYLKTSRKTIEYNSSQLQNILSTMCGFFCCYIAKELSIGRPFYDVLYDLSQIDRSKNDAFLKSYFNV